MLSRPRAYVPRVERNTDSIVYGIDNGTVYAYDLKFATTSLHDQQFNGKEIKPARWNAPALWKLKTVFSGLDIARNGDAGPAAVPRVASAAAP